MTFYCTFAKRAQRYGDHCNESPTHHPSPIITILLTSSIPTTPHHIILINQFFPNLFLTNRTHKSQIGFAHCCASLTFSPENAPGDKLIPEAGNHHTWGFQLENKSVGMEEAGRSPKEKTQHCSLVMPQSPGRPRPRPADRCARVHVYMFCGCV